MDHSWIAAHGGDQPLAVTLAQMHDHVGMLDHKLDDGESSKTEWDTWQALEHELSDKAMRLADTFSENGPINSRVAPSIDAQGCRDDSRWWLSKRGDSLPPSTYVPVVDSRHAGHGFSRSSREARSESIAVDPLHAVWEDWETFYNIETPMRDGLWMVFSDERLTLGYEDTHNHCDWYERDLQMFEENVRELLGREGSR